MWYPSQRQQQCWNGYVHHLPQQQQQHQKQSYGKTSYYCNTDESLNRNQATVYAVGRNDENEPLVHYHPTRVNDVYVAGADYYVTSSSGSYTDEMSSSSSSSSIPCQTSTTHWNPVIAAPTKTLIPSNNLHPQTIKPSSSSSSSSSSACWDWLLYPPEIYSHLYIPSSSFIQQQQQQQEADELDLIASLPTWLLALLYPSMKEIHSTDEENDSDQEISSLNNNTNNNQRHDEPLLSMNIDPKITRVSSENPPSHPPGQSSQQNRSSTPDTDDGYQSASDASRSDYSQQSSLHYDHHHHPNKDEMIIHVPSSLMPKRISYAAAVKPMITLINQQKISPSLTPIIKTKNHSSAQNPNDLLNNNGQKSKFFIAPRFERMHHAKQYFSPTTTTTTMTNKDSSSSSSSSTTPANRAGIRSNNNHHHHQRNHIIHSSRRR